MGIFDKGIVGGKPRAFKKCPECYATLLVNVDRCFSCKAKVGPVDAKGYARRPTDWKSYFLCFLSWALFGLYVWWVFFKEKNG
ncbi:MAG: hypothetical protein CSA22_07520 [Deltaproteobacteria bacterium]|nr:MAG: hypothetical protein CSA22_07520 [Deltaproteobacteria bacterium]